MSRALSSRQLAAIFAAALAAASLTLALFSDRAGALSAVSINSALVDVNTNLAYQGSSAAGTGIVLTSNGRILTNNHVIRGATTIRVTDIGNGRTYSASVVGYSVSDDVAVLQLKGASGLATASIGSSSGAKVGDAVVAIGNAGGMGGTPSASSGTITRLGRSIVASDDQGGSQRLTGLIETDAELQPGDSGGALVDSSGRVIGLLTAASQSPGFQFVFQGQTGNQGYAVPIAHALSVAQAIVSGKGSARIHIGATALLGVSVQSATAGFYDPYGYYGDTPSGAVIGSLLQGGAAAEVGLSQGDVITSLGGKKVSTSNDLTTILLTKHPGDTIKIGWTEVSGSHRSATAKLGSGPPQ